MKKIILISIAFLFIFCKNETKQNFDDFFPVDKQDQIIKHQYYTIAYCPKYKEAVWVGYNLSLNMIKGKAKRPKTFSVDPLLIYPSAQNSDYYKSGYDKGHLCPAADMKFSQTAMNETFYLSNVSPQRADLNRDVWDKLEKLVRSWLSTIDSDLFIFTGTLFDKTNTTIGDDKIAVPYAFYKIIYDYKAANQKMIAFIMPNKECNKRLAKYVVPVDSIQKLTNIDFFPKVDLPLQTKLEAHSDTSQWNWQ